MVSERRLLSERKEAAGRRLSRRCAIAAWQQHECNTFPCFQIMRGSFDPSEDINMETMAWVSRVWIIVPLQLDWNLPL